MDNELLLQDLLNQLAIVTRERNYHRREHERFKFHFNARVQREMAMNDGEVTGALERVHELCDDLRRRIGIADRWIDAKAAVRDADTFSDVLARILAKRAT